ncbi:MAG: ATP-binding protein [Bacteroidia bacterium]|nr:ATP-binding protein [Bacteroidia bacterium]
MYIERDIELALQKNIRHFSAVALTGPRQTGKSTLLKKKFGNKYQYLTFDDPLLRERAIADTNLFLGQLEEYVILDEVQYVPQILPFLKIIIDKKPGKKGRFILTGSQQFQLMKKISESLAGRIALFNLLPFGFDETRSVKTLSSKINSGEVFFSFACLQGLFPELCVTKGISSATWFGSYFQTYLERDIRTLYNIGNLSDFFRFIRLLASRCSQIVNMSNYSKELGISINTVKSWISILEASQLVYVLQPFSNNLGKRIIKNPKLYWNDSGMVANLTGVSSKEILFHGPLSGALFENLVLQETVKFFYNNGLRPNLYFLRTSNGIEADLIIEHGFKVYPFEIKLTKSPNTGMAKPLETFHKLFGGLKIEKGNIICLSDESYELSRNVFVLSIKDYLTYLKKIFFKS